MSPPCNTAHTLFRKNLRRKGKSSIDGLQDEPESEKKERWDLSDCNKKENRDQCHHPSVRVEKEITSQYTSDRSRSPNQWKAAMHGQESLSPIGQRSN